MSKNPNLSPETQHQIDIARCAQALRSTQLCQITGQLVDSEGGACAIGVLLKEIDPKFSELNPRSPSSQLLKNILSPPIWHGIVDDNNVAKLTFAQIADKLERGDYG